MSPVPMGAFRHEEDVQPGAAERLQVQIALASVHRELQDAMQRLRRAQEIARRAAA